MERTKSRNKKWTFKEEQFLLQNPTTDISTLQTNIKTEFGVQRSVKSISHKRSRLKLLSLRSNPEVLPTAREYDIILGSVLGDGYIEQQKSRNAKLYIAHTPKQINYLMWKASLLKRLGWHVGDHVVRDHVMHHYYTNHNPYFNQFRQKWYSPNSKNKDICLADCENINSLSLLVWYLDDGDYQKDSSIRISTGCYTFEKVLDLSDIIFNNLGIKFNVNQEGKYSRLTIYNNVNRMMFYKKIIYPYLDQISNLSGVKHKIPNKNDSKKRGYQ